MAKRYFLPASLILFFTVTFLTSSVAREWIPISASAPTFVKPSCAVMSDDMMEVSFHINGFYREKVNTPAGESYIISAEKSASLLQAGNPDLARLTASVIIPDAAEMQVEVIYSVYQDFNMQVAPSKGNLKRNIDPSAVPYTYAEAFTTNTFFPGMIADLSSPYILRDYRGQTLCVYPFQYNPVTQTLRVYTDIKVKVSASGNPSTVNVFSGAHSTRLDPDFHSIYRNHFINYMQMQYLPLGEHGNMLIICPTTMMSAMQPFVNWKNKMGQFTEIVDVSTIGATATDIKTYVEGYYNLQGLTFLLIVGDGPQIPPYPSASGDSDPAYGYITGGDSYAEVLVGRFSAENIIELQTQVQRSLDYEMNPDPLGEWYHKAVCIGSDQGPGDDNEMDFEHERNIRTDYLGYFYTEADELYDGSQGGMDAQGNPDPSDLVASINDGRSVITYTGHGSSSSLGTTGFGASDVSDLTNSSMLPYIWSVACVNGDFNSGTCLAEALMRANDLTGKATGAIATLMATINQSWDPPMDAQDEMVDLLVESYTTNVKHSFGGISVNGCMHMNDQYGSAGDEMTDTWLCFGDPSLTVRTNTPVPITVTHDADMDELTTLFTVNVPMDGALACLSHNNQIVGTAWSLLGSAIIPVTGILAGDSLDLTVTAYNTIPYFATVPVTATSTTDISTTQQNHFSVYPNPAGSYVKINRDNSAEAQIELVNSLGQIVKSWNESGKVINADFSSCLPGIYLLRVTDKNNSETQSLLIQ
jgi:hypothetical protein